MSLKREGHQKSTENVERPKGAAGEAQGAMGSGESLLAANGSGHLGATAQLMERVVVNDNVVAALKRVEKNKGSPGVDGMRTDDLRLYLRENWRTLKQQLLEGTYQPQPVRTQEIPKSGGGVRQLGIPTVLDRFIQQAILQVLQPMWDPTFSRHSYGFRPGRSAHDAVRAAHAFILAGKTWVVDVDLDNFFGSVNWDVLLERISRRVEDKRMLGLIRRFLGAGMMSQGVVVWRHEGTPQGGPLSPLLANLLLDEVDKELEQRGHAFCRYADDSNVYVKSRRAAERVMKALTEMFEALHLKVNTSKSAVGRPWERRFLGFTFKVGRGGVVKVALSEKAQEAFKDKVRDITARSGGKSIKQVLETLRTLIPGWKNYFNLAQVRQDFHDLEGWMLRRLRALCFKQWKHGPTVYRKLVGRGADSGLAARVAMHAKRMWWVSRQPMTYKALPNTYFFNTLKLPRLAVP